MGRIENLAKEFARTVVRPLVPDQVYANIVARIYSMARVVTSSEWRDYIDDPRLDPVLKEMMLSYENTRPTNVSDYWKILNKKSIEKLLGYGYSRFKQTVGLYYFTNTGGGKVQAHFLEENLSVDDLRWARENSRNAPKHFFLSREKSDRYSYIVYALWRYAERILGKEAMDKLTEPSVGSPPAVHHNGRLISEDLANSALEVHSIATGLGGMESIRNVLEMGAGYGRTGFALLNLYPHLKYFIVDIPPALYVSQKYLTAVCPGRKAFPFRSFQDFAQIEDEFMQADVGFLMPMQISQLPDRSVDLFIAIDCLHEMRLDAIRQYFEEIDRIAGYFYFTCRKTAAVPYDGHILNERDYPILENWVKVFHRPRDVHTDYFEALYKIHPSN